MIEEFDMKQYLDTPEAIVEYLAQVFQEEDADEISRALAYMSKSLGYDSLESFFEQDKSSCIQLIAEALRKKIAAIDDEDYLNKRAEHGDRKRAIDALKKIPNVLPVLDDYLENKKAKLEAIMKFAGMWTGETGNMTIQELKDQRHNAKNTDNAQKGEKLKEALQKIKELDQSIIEDFDDTLMDGLE